MDDTISRNMAIKAMQNELEHFAIYKPGSMYVIGIGVNEKDVIRILGNLPSAGPDVPDRNVGNTEITEEAIKEYCRKRCLTILTNDCFYKLALAQPERKRGRWKLQKNGNAICSECGFVQVSAWDADGWDNFCHHCGADMRGEEQNG